MFAFFAAEPAFARMAMVEVYAAGTAALDRRDRTVGSLQVLLDPGFERAPKTPRIASEAIGGATYALIYRQIRSEGPESLPMLTPSATYIALAPFLGPAEALAVANGRRGR
jgi:hypothetical protein